MSGTDQSDSRRVGPPRVVWIAAGVALVAAVVAAMIGEGPEPAARVASLVSVWVFAGWAPAAYLLGAIGIGTLARRWTRDIPGGIAIDAGLGIGATLTVTHGLGMLGLLNPLSAWVWTGAGLLLLAAAWHKARTSPDRLKSVQPTDGWSVTALLFGATGLGIMLSAGSLPPGVLWASEFGGYDAMSYHLQLPAEWLETGRITPVEHNVYSFLPGYFEAATLHLAHLSVAPALTPGGLNGFLGGTGDLALSAHFLAVGLAGIGAWSVGAFARTVSHACGLSTVASERSGSLASALVLVTPWVQVVGTLAYNETGVIALGGAALAASAASGVGPVRRGVLVALLIGAACGCKPTAILFLAPACAVLMLWRTPARRWAPMLASGAAVGLLMLAPWMVRNAMHGGNPVFPQGVSLLGTAHWSDEQAERYKGGHSFDGSVADRAMMLVRPDPATDQDTPTVARFRGLTNPQWALTPWLGIAGIGVLMASRRSRAPGAMLAFGLGLGLVAWLVATHLQSRFLVVMIPLFACGFGVGAARIGTNGLLRSVVTIVLAVSVLWSLRNYSEQRDGSPNRLLAAGSGLFTGRIEAGELSDEITWSWINRNATDGTLLLVGDAAPFYYRRPVVYATTWDSHPLAEIMRGEPDSPQAWSEALRVGGADWVLISFGELDRLAQSGWGDPMLAPDRVAAWADTLGPPVRVWSGGSTALFRIGD